MKKELPGKMRLTGNDVIDTAYTVSALYEDDQMDYLENLINGIDYDKFSDEYNDDIYEYFSEELGIELEDSEIELIEEMIR